MWRPSTWILVINMGWTPPHIFCIKRTTRVPIGNLARQGNQMGKIYWRCGLFVVRNQIRMFGIHCLLTSNISESSVEFLDLTLSLHDVHIVTCLFRKPTATNSLLRFPSKSPKKKGIQYGQYLRLKRNCSRQVDFNQHPSELTDRFRRWGYPWRLLTQACQRAANIDR